MRKPREFSGYGPYSRCIKGDWRDATSRIWVARWALSPDAARKLATWLLKAADWLEEKEGEG